MGNSKEPLEHKSSYRFVFESCYSITTTGRLGKTVINVKKLIVYFFIIYRLLFGLAAIGIGVAILLNWSVIKQELGEYLTAAPWLFIAVGAVMFIIAFFGCCGAMRVNHCILFTYAILLLAIIIVQVVLAILMLVYSDNIKEVLVKSIENLFDKRAVDPAAEALFNKIQEKFQCCGKISAVDYGLFLPQSCCPQMGTVGTIIKYCTLFDAYIIGCKYKVGGVFEKCYKIIAVIAIVMALIEVIGVLFALLLANSIKK